MRSPAIFDRKFATAGLLAILLLVLGSSGCVVDRVQVQSRSIVLKDADGILWVPVETAERLQCDDGLILVCTTGSGRLSNRECRCQR